MYTIVEHHCIILVQLLIISSLKSVSRYVSYREASIAIRIVSWGECIIAALIRSPTIGTVVIQSYRRNVTAEKWFTFHSLYGFTRFAFEYFAIKFYLITFSNILNHFTLDSTFIVVWKSIIFVIYQTKDKMAAIMFTFENSDKNLI